MNLEEMVYNIGVEKYFEKKAAISRLFRGAGHSSPIWHDLAEVGGLGILAAPNVSELGGKKWSKKNVAIAEVGGLGLLATPSAQNIWKHLRKVRR
jgi:hypothetical protein